MQLNSGVAWSCIVDEGNVLEDLCLSQIDTREPSSSWLLEYVLLPINSIKLSLEIEGNPGFKVLAEGSMISRTGYRAANLPES